MHAVCDVSLHTFRSGLLCVRLLIDIAIVAIVCQVCFIGAKRSGVLLGVGRAEVVAPPPGGGRRSGGRRAAAGRPPGGRQAAGGPPLGVGRRSGDRQASRLFISACFPNCYLFANYLLS